MAPRYDRRSFLRFGLSTALAAGVTVPALPAKARKSDAEMVDLLSRTMTEEWFEELARTVRANGGAVIITDRWNAVETEGFTLNINRQTGVVAFVATDINDVELGVLTTVARAMALRQGDGNA